MRHKQTNEVKVLRGVQGDLASNKEATHKQTRLLRRTANQEKKMFDRLSRFAAPAPAAKTIPGSSTIAAKKAVVNKGPPGCQGCEQEIKDKVDKLHATVLEQGKNIQQRIMMLQDTADGMKMNMGGASASYAAPKKKVNTLHLVPILHAY